MPKSASLRLGDVRSIVRIVNDCRDLGDDWATWQRHALNGILELTDSDFAIGGEVGGMAGPKVHYLSPPVFHGLPGFTVDLGLLDQVILEHTVTQRDSHFANDYQGRWHETDGAALTNQDFYTDRDWQKSFDMQTIGAVAGTDAVLLCCREVRAGAVAPGEVEDVTLFREQGRRGYSARDRTIVQEVVANLAPLMGGPLARFHEPSAANLPPRVRAVLACFLEGDGDKQVAARLGISAHTVNQHAKRIFRHFGVASRTELLARWVRRGWTTRGPQF